MSVSEAGMYINGEVVEAHAAARIDVVNPATEEVIGTIADGNAADVNAAVQAAQRALHNPDWSGLTPVDRAELIRRFARSLEKRGEEIATVVSSQNGMPFTFSQWANSSFPAESYDYFAGLAESFEPEELRAAADGTKTLIRQEPVGVAGLIVPWNGPQALLSWKLGPALAAGNTVVVKPAPETSLDLRYLWEAAIEAGFPPGVINIVTGGRETGQAVVDHPGVRKVAFTGSSAAGRAIAAACGAALKPVTLELGGKSAAILLEDADLERFVADAPLVCTPVSGQVCYSNTRILAPRSRYDEVVEALSATMKSLTVGDPFEPTTVMGPLVAERQRERVEGYIGIGRSEGARIAIGGGRPGDQGRGYDVQPTVFADVDPNMRIAQEEIFGPVAAVIPYADEADAVAIANNSEYGLGGVVYSADDQRATDVARRVETGTIGINRYGIDLNAPFGGYKASGLGRELGPDSLRPYLQTKTLYV